jgi:hypothetical protein
MGEHEEKADRPAAIERPSADQTGSARHAAGMGKARLAIKGSVAVILSVLALFVSAVTAYFNIFRTEENVSAIPVKVPFAQLESDDTLYIRPTDEAVVIFINSGNRPAVIRWVHLFYGQPATKTEFECAGAHFATNLEPTVVKPNDVIVSKMRITEPLLWFGGTESTRRADGALSFPISHDNLSKADVVIDICLRVTLATPSTISHDAVFPLIRYHAVPTGLRLPPHLAFGEQPVVLIRKMGTIFGR